MNEKTINILAVYGTTFLGFLLLCWFLFKNPVADFVEFVSGMDNRPASIAADTKDVKFEAFYATFNGKPSQIKGSWPRFRGADFNNINKEKIKLADKWSAAGPAILWSVDLGEGYGGPVIANGRVYLLDYDEEKKTDLLRCFSFDDGKEIWRCGYDMPIKRNHGISRTVPAVAGKYVVSIGPKCHVMCVDADSGTFRWGIDLVKKYKAEVPLWYTGQCPLIDDSVAVIAVGGKSLIIGVNCKSGEVLWETPNPNNWKMSHSSVIPYNIHGKEMYVYCALGGIVGISAKGEYIGKVMFETRLWNKNVVVPSPLYLGDGKLFVTTGYGGGSMMLKINAVNDSFAVDSVQQIKPEEGIASELQTPVFYKDHLFSVLPKDAGPLRGQFVCYHPDDIRKLIWASGTANHFGFGPYLVADDKFFVLSDEGVLTVMKASAKELVLLAQAKILNGQDAWGPMALVDGRLLARDSKRLVCVDIRGVK